MPRLLDCPQSSALPRYQCLLVESHRRRQRTGMFRFPKHPSRSEEHTSELQSLRHLVCRLLLEKKNALHTKRQNLFQELDAVIHLLMEAKHWGLRKSRNATSLNSSFKSLDTLKVKIISVTFRRVIRTNHKKASKIWRHENILLCDYPASPEIYTLSLHDALPI